MTVLFSTDFESDADFAIPAGWQAPNGGASYWMVRDVDWLAANGTKTLTSPGSSAGTPAEFVGIADRTTVEYEFRQKAAIDGTNQYIIGVSHSDHMIGNPTDFAYRFLFTATTSSVTADISPFIGGAYPGVQGTGTRGMPTAAGDIIGVKVRIENKICSVWVWNTTHESMPAAPLATWTDTVQRAAGHFGIYWMNGGVVLLGLDQFVISDGAAGGGGTSLPAAAAGAAVASGTANASLGSPAVGTITIPALKDWQGNLKTSEAGITVLVNDLASGALVVKKTGQSSHATTAVVAVSDASIVAGTWYRVTTILADGSEGTWKYQAT